MLTPCLLSTMAWLPNGWQIFSQAPAIPVRNLCTNSYVLPVLVPLLYFVPGWEHGCNFFRRQAVGGINESVIYE